MDFFIIIPSTLFFYLIFEGYIKPKYIITIVLICITLYFTTDTVYAMGPENLKEPIEVKISDNQNTINLNNASFNIPNSVAKGLTNVGTGAAVAAGIKAGASVAKSTGLTPASLAQGKIGVMAAGAVIAGGTIAVVNNLSFLDSSKVTTSEQAKTLSSNPPSPTNSPYSAFSVEPAPDMDTVLNLLNANYVLHICITYVRI